MGNRIRILATSDIHGFITPYSYTDGMTQMSGLARLSTLISLLRDENTILIDNGDTMYGSPLCFHHFKKEGHGPSPVTRVMEHIGYDYFNLGNHDFSYGVKALTEHVDALSASCITSNITFRGRPFGPTWAIREVSGKKIALFGVLTPFTGKSEAWFNVKPFRFRSAFETALKTVELVRSIEKPDYVICVCHSGFERDAETGLFHGGLESGENEAYRILKEVHGIDILITGHQHRSLCGTSGDTVYTQVAKDGAELACIDIFTDTGVIEPRLLKADTEPDYSVMAMIREDEEECQAWLDESIAVCDRDMSIEDELDARLHKNQSATLINMALKDFTGADLSSFTFCPGACGLPAKITNRSLFGTLTQPGSVVVKKITGKVLRAYLEKCASFFTVRNESIDVSSSARGMNYTLVDGVEYTIRVSNDPGQRIEDLTFKGMPVEDDMEFTIVLNSYRAAGSNGYEMLSDCPVIRTPGRSTFDIVSEYLKEHKEISFEPVNNITVIR